MGNMLYLECTSGISGDMTVAALLDAGAREDVLRRALDSLPVDGFSVRVSRVKKSGLDACDFAVLLDAEHENHDHDMAYLHGPTGAPGDAGRGHAHGGDAAGHAHGHGSSHAHAHGGDGCGHVHDDVLADDAGHDRVYPHAPADATGHGRPLAVVGGDGCDDHGHPDPHSHPYPHSHSHDHEHRGLPEILALIDAADMTDRAKAIARRTFEVLADAEAKAHGVSRDEVHFHEVGAVDSIADVVAAAVCFDDLGATDVVVPLLCEGRGTVRCQHGIIPVPVPAVVNIVSAHGIPLRLLDVQGELVTPTGAALAAAVRTRTQLPERFVVERVGIGAGKRDYATPGILRALVIREEN